MTIKTWQETVGVAPDDDEYRYPCAMQDEIDELRREINKKQEAYESALTGWSDQIALVTDLCAQCKELRAALAEYEKKYPKSIAECCVGQCDCDPQIEACPRCAPGLFEKGTP